MLWPRPRSLSAMCPACVRHLSALCCWLGPRLQSLSATCPPDVPHVSVLCRHVFLAWAVSSILVRLVSALCCWLLSAMCPPYVRLACVLGLGRSYSLSATCPPVSAYMMSPFIVSGSASLCVHLCPGDRKCPVKYIDEHRRSSQHLSEFNS